jgi:hypothetical protein
MKESPAPTREEAEGESDDGAREPERRSNWSGVVVSILYAIAALLGSAAAVITALSGWDRI